MPRVVRPLIYFEHPLHAGHEMMALLLRNAPHFPPPRFQFVFFNALRTVSSQIDSTTSSRTSSSASIFTVHRTPNAAFRRNRTGHLHQRRALPSPHPAFFGTGGNGRGLRSRATIGPCSTTARRRTWTHVLAGPLRHPLRAPPPPPSLIPWPAESVHVAASSPTPRTTTRARLQHRASNSSRSS